MPTPRPLDSLVLSTSRSGSRLTGACALALALSLGAQGARSLRTMTHLAPTLLAAELVAAVRALRLAPGRLTDGIARQAFDLAAKTLDDAMDDRPLGDDLARAAALLPELGEL